MANQIENNGSAGRVAVEAPRSPAAPASAIHRLLNMTPEEVEADIAARGKSPSGVLAAFGKMERGLAARSGARGMGGSKRGGPPSSDYRLDMAAPEAFRRSLGELDWSRVVFERFDIENEDGANASDGFDTVALDTKSAPKDGDLVLANIGQNTQVVRKLRV